MGRTRLDLSNENTQKRLKKAGRGVGGGPGYKAGLTVMDVPSIGNSTRMPSWKHPQREFHFHSNLERDFFLTLEWDPSVVECREQYFLDLEQTLRLAEALGYRHPTHPKTKKPVMMSTDMVVTYLIEGVRYEKAIAVKPMCEVDVTLGGKPSHVTRVLEKLKIEQAYWEAKGCRWGLVTEENFDRLLAWNVLKIHGYYHLADLYPLTSKDVTAVHELLYPKVAVAGDTLSNLALACDKELGYVAGTSLKVARHLIATKRWPVDFTVPFDVCEKLVLNAEVM